MFSDAQGNYCERNYLEVVAGLAKGEILICELWSRGQLADRWLMHRDYNDEFGHLASGEELKVIRPMTSKSGESL
jgi:hypothetical protein